jgi:phosphatidylglycerophosphatase C
VRRLVVFDLDGTLTRHDTLVPYVLGFLRSHPQRLLALLGAVPALLAFALGLSDRGRLKSAFIRAALHGCTRAEIETHTQRFVEQLLARGMRAQALEALEQHRRLGDVLVLLSASPDLYVPALGARLGFQESLCTGVRFDGERLEGSLTTLNRRGPEKTRCLLELRQRFPGLPLVAYGNARSDLDHLSRADEGWLVNASRAARSAAQRLGVSHFVQWR